LQLDESTEMPDPIDAVHTALCTNGYVILPSHLDKAVLTKARAEIGELVAGADWGSGFDGCRTRRVWALLSRTRCLDAAALDPLVLAVADRVLGPGSQFSLTQATQIHPGQTAQVLHYEQGIYPLPRDRDVMLTAIWALDDFSAANGATLVVPGSHQGHDRRPDMTESVSAEMPAGSVLVFLGRLWHAGGANVTNRPRLGVIIDYVQPWLRPCEAHTLSANLNEARDLPVRLQELLGFNQATPYLGYIAGEHPRAWLAGRPVAPSGAGRPDS
jgi:ectoine hydroxylase-related dioxygenase (phytanoyl-CoA dioxygenase family)